MGREWADARMGCGINSPQGSWIPLLVEGGLEQKPGTHPSDLHDFDTCLLGGKLAGYSSGDSNPETSDVPRVVWRSIGA